MIKAYVNNWIEAKALMAKGYTLLSIAYFTSNPAMSFILEKK